MTDVDSRIENRLWGAWATTRWAGTAEFNRLARDIQQLQDEAVATALAESQTEINDLNAALKKVTAELASVAKSRDLAIRSHIRQTGVLRLNDGYLLSLQGSKNPLKRFAAWLARWPKATTELNQLKYSVTDEILAETHRQDVKWGEGRQMPNGTGNAEYGPDLAEYFKEETDAAFREGRGTWRHILEEEIYEAFAENNSRRLKTELVQAAAVIVQWLVALRKQKAKG